MTTYLAPTRDMQFVINELADLKGVAALSGFEEISPDLVEAVLDEAGRLASEVLAPLNKSGDEQGTRLQGGVVMTPQGFSEAYHKFVEGGWNGLTASSDYGGQGLPELLGTAVHEMWHAANMSFALCPMLTAAAIEAVKAHGSDTHKATYLPKLVSGEWSGTMNLTEPQAGSDLSTVRTKAVPEGDHYRLYGQKIFITWGDHDIAENVIHMVLARTPDAPEGVKGVSLFLVPKFIPDADGTPGKRNEVHCVSLEHKMGIHASPTCVMAFGDKEGAVGYLVGEKNKGLSHMFTMMNEARLKVGVEGLGIADRAYQQAADYAKDRIQGRPAGAKEGGQVNILHHPDVRRMLLTMKSQVEAMRALCYVVAMSMDMARHHPDAEVRKAHHARVDLLTPVVKGWCTELGIEVASLGVQVHGGIGYIEETGACQYLRDSRIATIYEGTTGIQAADLVRRKLAMDQGAAMNTLIKDMRSVETQLESVQGDDMAIIRESLAEGIQALDEATQWTLSAFDRNPDSALAGSVNYLMLTGYVCGGWQMARAALAAQARLASGENPSFHEAKLITARFYAEQILPKAGALLKAVKSGGKSTTALSEEQF